MLKKISLIIAILFGNCIFGQSQLVFDAQTKWHYVHCREPQKNLIVYIRASGGFIFVHNNSSEIAPYTYYDNEGNPYLEFDWPLSIPGMDTWRHFTSLFVGSGYNSKRFRVIYWYEEFLVEGVMVKDYHLCRFEEEDNVKCGHIFE